MHIIYIASTVIPDPNTLIQALNAGNQLAKFEEQNDVDNICKSENLNKLSNFLINESIFKHDVALRCVENEIYCHPLDTNVVTLPLEQKNEYVSRRILNTLDNAWMKTAMNNAKILETSLPYTVCSLFIYLYI